MHRGGGSMEGDAPKTGKEGGVEGKDKIKGEAEAGGYLSFGVVTARM